jgi:hypothetical protein
VYKGYVKGRKVAVKVRHPGVDEQIALDFRIMRAVGHFIDSLPVSPPLPPRSRCPLACPICLPVGASSLTASMQ